MWIAFALAAQAAPATPPDIQLDARVTARRVEVRSSGEARLEVRAQPDAGSSVRVERNLPRDGRRSLRNLDIRVRAEARLAAPGAAPPDQPRSQ